MTDDAFEQKWKSILDRRAAEREEAKATLTDRGATEEAGRYMWLVTYENATPSAEAPPGAFSPYANGFVWISPWEPFTVSCNTLVWKRHAMKP